VENKVPEVTEENTPEEPALLSRTSRTGTVGVLETMLRIEVEYPENKVLNLKAEFEEYLEDNGLVDMRDNNSKNNPLSFGLKNKTGEVSNEGDDIAEEGDEPEAKFNPKDFMAKPIGQDNYGYSNVIKGLITRIEQEGTLGKRREYGRATKGKKMNEERDQEFYYNLDDDFIDDGGIHE